MASWIRNLLIGRVEFSHNVQLKKQRLKLHLRVLNMRDPHRGHVPALCLNDPTLEVISLSHRASCSQNCKPEPGRGMLTEYFTVSIQKAAESWLLRPWVP